jgi:hypothetical protein
MEKITNMMPQLLQNVIRMIAVPVVLKVALAVAEGIIVAP